MIVFGAGVSGLNAALAVSRTRPANLKRSVALVQRMRFPHLFAGAVASSATVSYAPTYDPYSEFKVRLCLSNRGSKHRARWLVLQQMSEIFKGASAQCYANIQKSWGVMTQLAVSATGRAQLSLQFATCQPLQNPDDVRGSAPALLLLASTVLCCVDSFTDSGGGYAVQLDHAEPLARSNVLVPVQVIVHWRTQLVTSFLGV